MHAYFLKTHDWFGIRVVWTDVHSKAVDAKDPRIVRCHDQSYVVGSAPLPNHAISWWRCRVDGAGSNTYFGIKDLDKVQDGCEAVSHLR